VIVPEGGVVLRDDFPWQHHPERRVDGEVLTIARHHVVADVDHHHVVEQVDALAGPDAVEEPMADCEPTDLSQDHLRFSNSCTAASAFAASVSK